MSYLCGRRAGRRHRRRAVPPLLDRPARQNLSEHLGEATTRLLGEVLVETDVLGLPWARSIDILTKSMRNLPAVDVVQLCGAMEVPGVNSSAVDIVRRAAQTTGGAASIFHAALLLDDEVTASRIRRERHVAHGLAQTARVTTAVVGIGAWEPGLSTIYDAVSPADREEARAAGVVGEIAGRFFDADGRFIEPALSKRIITIGAKELCAIPEVIGIVGGRPKAPAVAAALRGGLVNAVVVDIIQCDALLAEAETSRVAAGFNGASSL